METLFLGIDSSTQGCKMVCINPATRQIEYVDSVHYDADLPHYKTRNGVIQSTQNQLSEADPRMWLEALHRLFDRMLEKNFPLRDIRAISVSGQQHGLVTLDENGNLTRTRSKLWNDYSTAQECELLTGKMGGTEKMIAAVGNTQRPGYTAGKIYHLYRHEPEAAWKTTTFFLVHNYINWYLTGGKNRGARVMEPGDVSGMALRYPGANRWAEALCNIISSDLIRKLPPVKPSDQFIGTISPELAERYGFPEDCRIDAGCGDNMYGAVGTGNIEPGLVTISLGTSGTAYTIFDDPYVDPQGEIASFCDSTGRFMPLLCVSNMANGYTKMLELFELDHQGFTDVLKRTPPGNNGRILFPWFMGERTPDLPHATPLYWGFQPEDFTKEVLCRAVLEGHVLNLYEGFRRMPVKGRAREIRLTGGLSQSEAWQQTIADVFDTETVPVEGEGAALGAAVHAAWVYFKQQEPEFPLKNLTTDFVQLNQRQRKYPRYAKNYQALKDIYHELSFRIRQPAGEIDPFKETAAFKK